LTRAFFTRCGIPRSSCFSHQGIAGPPRRRRELSRATWLTATGRFCAVLSPRLALITCRVPSSLSGSLSLFLSEDNRELGRARRVMRAWNRRMLKSSRISWKRNRELVAIRSANQLRKLARFRFCETPRPEASVNEGRFVRSLGRSTHRGRFDGRRSRMQRA